MKSSYLKFGVGAILAGVAVVLLDALFLEKYFFQIKRFVIGKKSSSRRIKILLLTDLHFKHRFTFFHRRLAKKINELNPDVIFIAGDVIDETGKPHPAKQFFSLLKHAIPILAIPGNHDVKNKVSRGRLKKILSQHNGHLLLNETKQIVLNGETITVTGLDDFIESEGCFADAVKNTGKEKHHFLLVHSPLQQEKVLQELKALNEERTTTNQVNIQYIFAGHNHGGQIRLFNYAPVLPKEAGKYLSGWYNEEKPYLYVSRGYGTTHLPFRFGARAEITLLEYGV